MHSNARRALLHASIELSKYVATLTDEKITVHSTVHVVLVFTDAQAKAVHLRHSALSKPRDLAFNLLVLYAVIEWL